MVDLTFSKEKVRQRAKHRSSKPDPRAAEKRKFIQMWHRRWAGRNVPDANTTAEIAWYIHYHTRAQRMQEPDKRDAASGWQVVDQTVEARALFFSALGIPRKTDSELVFATKPPPGAFNDAESFRNAYWAAESWSKFPFELEGVDRQRSAAEAFIGFERQCAVANERLYDAFNKASIPENIRGHLARARAELASLFAGISLDDWMHRCTHSGGASYGLSRVQSAVQNKFGLALCSSNGATATPRVLPYVDCFQRYAGWSNRVSLVPGNLIEWVPKNAKTDRTIAIEPEWNMFFQQGLGREIRSRLQRRWGLLWPTAQHKQQQLAAAGSRTGTYATLDLRGASDCVSVALCELLLPPTVFQWLEDLRSPVGIMPDGTRVSYEKISSMGNGFTFELETALFAAICRSISHDVHVYGDDIILPRENALIAMELLEFCGFTINTDKSFVVGPFRESCGGHYFEGVSVTPPYFKKPLIGHARMTAANALRKCAAGGGMESDGVFRATWECLVRGVPKKFFGPSCMGGSVFHVPSSDLRRTFYDRNTQQVYWKGTGIRLVAKPQDAPGLGAVYAWLYDNRNNTRRMFIESREPKYLTSHGLLKTSLREELVSDVDSSYEQYAREEFVPVFFDWKQPTWQLNDARPWSL